MKDLKMVWFKNDHKKNISNKVLKIDSEPFLLVECGHSQKNIAISIPSESVPTSGFAMP